MEHSTRTHPTGRRAILRVLLKPTVFFSIVGATVIVGVVASLPMRDGIALARVSDGLIGQEQKFALSSIGAAVRTAVAERDQLASDVSDAQRLEELIATRDQAAWARLVLHYGGWTVTEAKVAAITQWMQAENFPETWWLRNNPLNNGWYTSTGDYLGSYSSLDQAAYYAADSIRNRGIYPGIAAALGDDSASTEAIAAAIIDSGWATGFYGGGSHWNTGEVPAVGAPGEVWGR